jgi:sulfide:quinone oxidoreductase
MTHIVIVGTDDSKGMLESELRGIDVKWITNTRVTKAEPGRMFVTELDDQGQIKRVHDLPLARCTMLSAFKRDDSHAGTHRHSQYRLHD